MFWLFLSHVRENIRQLDMSKHVGDIMF